MMPCKMAAFIPFSRSEHMEEGYVIRQGWPVEEVAIPYTQEEKAIVADMDALIVAHHLFQLYQHEVIDEVKRLTICNLWRIERYPDHSVKTFEFDLATAHWESVNDVKHWPNIPFFPNETRSLAWWRDCIKSAINAVINHLNVCQPRKEAFSAWFYAMPVDFRVSQSGETALRDHHVWCEQFSQLINRFKDYYCGDVKAYRNRRGESASAVYSTAALPAAAMQQQAGQLRKHFTKDIVDVDLLKAMMVFDYRNIPLDRYLTVAQNHHAVIRVFQERRNLLPLLFSIKPECWARTDLFSRRVWLRQGGIAPIQQMLARDADNPFDGFDDVASWRYFSKLSSVILRKWIMHHNTSFTIMTNLAKANVSCKAPVIAYVELMQFSHLIDPLGVSPITQHLFRIYLNEAARRWAADGHAAVKTWLNQNELSYIMDYVCALRVADGQPARNATWQSLLRAAQDWHTRVAIEGLLAHEDSSATWSAPYPETTYNGYTFTPLTTAYAMAREGYEMSNCLSTYITHCINGIYCAYAVSDEDGNRSTLGLLMSKDGKSVKLDQMERSHHRRPTNDELAAAAMLIRRINHQHLSAMSDTKAA